MGSCSWAGVGAPRPGPRGIVVVVVVDAVVDVLARPAVVDVVELVTPGVAA